MTLLRIFSISALLSLITAIGTIHGSPLPKLEDSKIHRINPIQTNSHSHNSHHHHHQFHAVSKARSKTLDKKSHHQVTNQQVLSKLGLSKLRIPSSHSRKRLAVESRHHARPDDSHMFVIKLPPNPYYYTNSKPAEPKNSVDDSGKKVSFSFRSNGKPGRIYHWNIPVLKKIANGDGRTANSKSKKTKKSKKRISQLIDIKNTPTWSKPWENETMEKSYSRISDDENAILKRKSPTYYAPSGLRQSPKKKNNFHKNFPGNGKPQGLYIIQKNHKPAIYQKLLPYK